MSKAKKIIVRVLLIIFVIISILSIIFTVFTIASSFSNRIIPTGIVSKNNGDVLYIASIADHLDSNSLSIISGDGAVEINNADRGWELIPKKSGRCGAVRELRYLGNPNVTYDMYDITVDENLNITYNEKRVEKFYPCDLVEYEDFQMTLQRDGNSVTVPNQTAIQVFKEMYGIYGTYSDTAPNLSECAKITYIHSMENYVIEFYISDYKIIKD